MDQPAVAGLSGTPLAGFALLCWAVVALVVLFRPGWGLQLVATTYPLGTVFFTVRGMWPFDAMVMPHTLVALVLLPSLLLSPFRGGAKRHVRTGMAGQPDGNLIWLFYSLALLFALSVLSLVVTARSAGDLIRWLSFAANFPILAYILVYLKTRRQLEHVLVSLLIAGALAALAAFYATYHAFFNERLLYASSDVSIGLSYGLYNLSGGFEAVVTGLTSAVGINGKHEVGIAMAAAALSGTWLFWRVHSPWRRAGILILMVLCFTGLNTVFVKLAMIGLFLVVAGCFLVSPALRVHLLAAMFALFAAFAVGSLAGKPARPYHERVVFAQSQRVGAVKSPSKFKVSTMAARMYYWEQSVERCLKSPWVGRGPDALLNDITYVMPHAHNVLIGVAVDYGIPAGVSALAVFALAFWRGIVAVLKNALPTCPDCMAAAATFSAFAVAFFDYSFDSFIWAPQLWVLLGVFLAATRVDLHMRLGVLVGPETGSRHCRPSAD